jgi:endonuclease/exonuclease/phosphatase family metal-dependent hydrolase
MPDNRAADDTIPLDLRTEFDRLRLALDEQIPPKRAEQNLLLATWNIREFDEFSAEWRSDSDEAPKRDLFSMRCIAEISSRFDVLVVQEVTGEERALAELQRLLGASRWGSLRSEGREFSGHREERMVFLFDGHRATPSGLACELIVLPGEAALPWDTFARQFTCTPFAVSFVACGRPLIVVTAHLAYGVEEAAGAAEMEAVGRWLANWAADEHTVGHNLLLVGDFGAERAGDPRFDAFSSAGLYVPSELQHLPREALAPGGGFYDQIGWFVDGEGNHRLSLDVLGAGAFDFTAPLGVDLRDANVHACLSDHLPLWVELGVG